MAVQLAPNIETTARDARPTILVVDDDPAIRNLLLVSLSLDYTVTAADSAEAAAEQIAQAVPDLVISDVNMGGLSGFEFVHRLRSNTETRRIPVIMLTALADDQNVVEGFELGADDYIVKPFNVHQLRARVHAKLDRPPVPKEDVAHDPGTGLRAGRYLTEEINREIVRTARGGSPGSLAYVYIDELPRMREQFGLRAERQIEKQVAGLLTQEARVLDIYGYNAQGYFVLLLPETGADGAEVRLRRVLKQIEATTFRVGTECLRLTPCAGYLEFGKGADPRDVMAHVQAAVNYARGELDLEPVRYAPAMDVYAHTPRTSAPTERETRLQQLWQKVSTPLQIALTLFVSLVLPLLGYRLLDSVGLDITPALYLVVVGALLITALMIWIEGLYAFQRRDPPAEPSQPYPPASAIIAAYLPNEAATILETIESFLRIQYPAPLQIILAYNTPRSMPIEHEFEEIARRDPRFVPLRVSASESKAQNINSALAIVTGEFVGIFDADHHPDPDNFTRAWRWLSHGYDIVQGHCLVRNGDATWISKLIAVEFEAIYAVSHPGRWRMHAFGIFGGSNGYWKTGVLRSMRMHRFMLTEDIDSSIRAVMQGYKIMNDPYIVSRELAPTSLTAFWNQRMRWAQGWFQVSKLHIREALRSPALTLRQKFGVFWLLGWREIYPWLSVQMFPIIVFWALKYGGLDKLDWLVPVFVMTTLFTLSVGPGQAFLSYRLADPQIRRNKNWFVYYLVMTSLFFTELKNLIARVAQIKEATHERKWRVTPRAAQGTPLEGGQA